MAERPFFTVLVPTYNHAGYLAAALDTLLAQTFSDWEAVVVNDGSTDDSPAVMERYAERDRRFRVVHKKNGGAASALNEGIRHARGEWICWLSSDDFFEPDKLEVHLKAIGDNPGIRFFYSHFSHLDDKTGVKSAPYPGFHRLVPSPPFQTISFFNWNYVHGNGIAVHRSVFDAVGFFNERLRNGQDFEMWLRISIRFPFHFINRRTCITRVHPGQGTVIFPEAGIFDGSRACVEFLNAHRYRELFPFLDLAKEAEAVKAARTTIDVSKDPDSIVNRCGYNTALLERFHEYLSEECPGSVRERLAGKLNRMIRPVLHKPLPETAKWQYRILGNGGMPGFRFFPHDFLAETIRSARRFQDEGKNKEAENIKRYLRIIGTLNESDGQHIERERIDDWETSGARPARRKKILLAARGFPMPRPAGAEPDAYRFAKALLAKGHDVAVLYRDDRGSSRPERILEGSCDGIRLYEVVARDVAAPRNSFGNRKIERLFRNILVEERFDVVHVDHRCGLPFSVPEAAKEFGIPVCLILDDARFLCPRVPPHDETAHESSAGTATIENCVKCLDAEEWVERYRGSVRKGHGGPTPRKNISDILSGNRGLAAVWKFLRGF